MYNLLMGNCLELMNDIPDKSIDMILCDLPYGITAPEWDSVLDMNILWKHYERIRKNNCPVVLFSSQPFTTKLINSNMNNFKYCWYWEKNQGTNFFHARRMPIRKIEEICIFYNGKYNPQMSEGHIPTNSSVGSSNGKTYHGSNKRNYKGGSTIRYPTNILKYKSVNNYERFHSAEKPVDLLEYLIRTYTNESELILDNCMGSGSTGIAAGNTGRNFIGMEMNENYYNMAEKRLSGV
ncbi:MAG: site-specific DNA-methyltransferase [Candidatus Levybacteria bacterium]|nr:site-specific DNA-methyltransferase [Candidatus Levybacteria bacterium]